MGGAVSVPRGTPLGPCGQCVGFSTNLSYVSVQINDQRTTAMLGNYGFGHSPIKINVKLEVPDSITFRTDLYARSGVSCENSVTNDNLII